MTEAMASVLPEVLFSGIDDLTPYLTLTRSDWSRLAASTEVPLSEDEIDRVRGVGDRIDEQEIREVYLPLSRLLNMYVEASQSLRGATTAFLGEPASPTPFVIGVSGSVAVGKSTTARILQELLCRWPSTPRVQLITTDGFLYPNAVLEARGLMERKGFPESYDRAALLRFVIQVKSGKAHVEAPVYSHLSYDIVPGQSIVVDRPDVLIVEGLNVLQPARPGDGLRGLAVSDFFDYSVFVHARKRDIRKWYVERFQELRKTAFADPKSFFHRFASLSDDEAEQMALQVWAEINEPNLLQNVRPTRGRARLVLSKAPDHTVQQVLLRKI